MSVVALKSYNVDIRTFKFFPVISGDTLNIIIHAEEVSNKDRERLSYVTKKYLINLLGEEDYCAKVFSYGFFLEPLNPDEIQFWQPMEKLTDFVDSFIIQITSIAL
jgi:hypothetical protein